MNYSFVRVFSILGSFFLYSITWLSAGAAFAEHRVDGQSSRTIASGSEPPAVVALSPSGQCDDVVARHGHERLSEGKLSPFWAKEIVGGDFAQLVVRNAGETSRTSVGVLDAGFDPKALPPGVFDPTDPQFTPELQSRGVHGQAVSNLVFDPVVGVAANAYFSSPAPMGFAAASEARFLTAAEVIRQRKPRLVNASYDLGRDPDVYNAFKPIADAGTLFVIASGNAYPSAPSENARNLPSILVGNLSPNGFVSSSSQQSSEVDILAPAGSQQLLSYVISRGTPPTIEQIKAAIARGEPPPGATGGGQRELYEFGATSGAAPLVTGAISNVLSLVPEISNDEIRAILTHTALPTINSNESPRRNGVGTLNAYKMAEVALRLRANWPARRAEILSPTSQLYDFRRYANDFVAKAEALRDRTDCHAKRERLSLLRQAYLLNPEETSRFELAALYEANGLSENAQFYRSISQSPSSLVEARLHPSQPIDKIQEGLRLAGNMGRQDLLKQAVQGALAQIASPSVSDEERKKARDILYYAMVSGRDNGFSLIPQGVAPQAARELLNVSLAIGDKNTVEQILGSDIPAEMKQNISLFGPIGSGNLELVRFLVERGANVAESDKIMGTPLIVAAQAPGNLEMLRLLVAKGADVNAMSQSGFSPLINAVRVKDIEMARFLLESGANARLFREGGKTPYQIAVAGEDTVMIELLCRYGADPQCPSAQTTPHSAQR